MIGKKITCVIPARLQSTRLPNKILRDLAGKPLMQRVWEQAKSCPRFDQVVLAIDSIEAKRVAEQIQANYIMTDPSCPSGTHRMIELVQSANLSSDIWVNWQADEPFICDEMIENLLQGIDENETVGIWTLKKTLAPGEWTNPNVVKVITDVKGHAIFFSRLPIPFYRDQTEVTSPLAAKHVGIYAYSDEALKTIAVLPPSQLAAAEMLEQLAYLEYGLPIRVFSTERESHGIDTEQDFQLALTKISRDASAV